MKSPIPAVKSIAPLWRKIFRRSRRVSVRETLASDESGWTVVDWDQISRTAEPPVDEDPEPRPADVVHQHEYLLPPDCDRLRSGDIEIFDTLPDRAGAFTNVWDGSLDGDRVVIKSYRLCYTTDPTQAHIVRFC